MSTPLAPFANAVVTIPVETYGVWDDETMSYTKQTIELKYDAIIKADTKLTKLVDASGGVDTEHLPVRGRLVNPQTFDDRVHFPITAKVFFTRENRNATIEVNLIIQSAYYSEAQTLGEPFSGIITYD